MRLVSTVLFVALTGSWALADEAKPADPKPEVTKKKVPYRVVKLLPETGQVLLFDKAHGSHVVAEVGQSLEGYLVDDIDEDEVTLVAENGAQIILTAPPPPRQPRRAAQKPTAPVDPYAEGEAFAQDGSPPAAASSASATSAAPRAAGNPTAPVDPYAEPEAPQAPGDGGVRVASATTPSTATPAPTPATATATPSPTPSTAMATPAPSPTAPPAPTAAPIVDTGAPELSDPYGDPGIAAFADAVGATPAPAPAPAAKAATKPSAKATASAPDAASTLAAAATGSPAPAIAKPAAAPAAGGPAPAAGTITIARAELDGALADFSKLAGSFRATFTPDGLRFDAIHDGTILTRIGLRKGDVITYVDGQPLRSLDDAATLYARAGTVKSTTVQVVRDGKLVTLRVAIQ